MADAVKIDAVRVGRGVRIPASRDAKHFTAVHELSIALSLIDAICEELPRIGAHASVRSVRVRLGPQSGVVGDALRFAFEVAVVDSPLAGARLEIESTNGAELELTALEVVDAAEDCRGSQEHPQAE